MPHLERWLARARIAREPGASAEAWLAARYGLEGAPVAAVTLAIDEAPQPGHWLRADPVYAQVERDSIVLHHAAMLAIRPDEAHAIVHSMRELFAGDGMEFHAPRPGRWYVRVPAGELPATTALPEALGRDVFGHLPRGGGTINWPSALTEAQMMLATHPVNTAREAEGRPPVNAIWFWGAGALPRELAPAYRRVCADEPFACGLAHLSSATLEAAPASVGGLGDATSTLVVLSSVAEALDTGDADAWRAAAASLDESWFARLGQALGPEPLRLVIPARSDTCVATLTPRDRWRIFGKSRPLASHA